MDPNWIKGFNMVQIRDSNDVVSNIAALKSVKPDLLVSVRTSSSVRARLSAASDRAFPGWRGPDSLRGR